MKRAIGRHSSSIFHRTNWKRRWAAVNTQDHIKMLYYFKTKESFGKWTSSPGENRPAGFLSLAGSELSVVDNDGDPKHRFGFMILLQNGDSFVAAADNAEQRLAWINTLSKVCKMKQVKEKRGQEAAAARRVSAMQRSSKTGKRKSLASRISGVDRVFTKPGNKEVKGMEGKRTSPASGKPRKVTNRQRMSAQVRKTLFPKAANHMRQSLATTLGSKSR